MNERIRKLAEQVGAVQNVLAMGRHDGVLFTETELEKFAELLIQECAAICYIRDFADGSGYGNEIEAHFGLDK
jgi:hypothetical protein